MTDRPVPPVRGEERVFFEEAAAQRLSYQQCDDCGTRMAYPHVTCTSCLSDRLTRAPAAGTGVVHSFTTLHRAGTPGLADAVPYTVVLVDLDEGVRVLADLVETAGAAPPWIDMPVEVVFEALTADLAIPRFRATLGRPS